jgi:hypothetical protein
MAVYPVPNSIPRISPNYKFFCRWRSSGTQPAWLEIMKSEQGMGTLMTVFSGVAALMCLLVGLQLLFLESQIGQAAGTGMVDGDLQFRQWEALAHTGAIMSLGAGVLILLFGVRHHTATGQTRKNRLRDKDRDTSTADLESLSVRVFEVDAQDRTVEITPGKAEPPMSEPVPRYCAPPPPGDQESDSELFGNTTDSIIQSIREASDPDSTRTTAPPAANNLRRSFFDRLFRRQRRG